MSAQQVDQLSRVLARVEAARGARGESEDRWRVAWDAASYAERCRIACSGNVMNPFAVAETNWEDLSELVRVELKASVRILRVAFRAFPD